jgi:hypothetical protein
MSRILRNRIRLRVQINDQEFYYKNNISVLEACESIGLDIPRFCYHQNLSVAGNCRMCLVEVANSPKPVASCALPISNNIKVYTNTPSVKKARENILEFLLLNHPLDCPICDQAGECDLQDQAKTFGIGYSRYFGSKRVVEDKNFNSLIKTVMTRCIHCTRCVRFDTEIAGKEFLGTLNRSTSTEIGSYINIKNSKQFFDSEIAGNVIDLCPVGALTSSSYAFKTRPWELRTKESIDLADSINTSIYVSSKETEIVRVFPKAINGINFLSDASRYYFDYNSLNRSLLRTDLNINFFFKTIEQKANKKILILIDKNLDLENLLYIKNCDNYIFKLILGNKKIKLNFSVKALSCLTINPLNLVLSWLSHRIKDLVNLNCRVCFFFCTNLKVENTILNLKIRLKTKQSFLKIFNFGLSSQTNIKLETINLNLNFFYTLFEANHPNSNLLIKHLNPIIVIGEAFYKRGLNDTFLYHSIKKISNAIILNLKNSLSSFSVEFLNIRHVTTRCFKTNNIICLNMNDSAYLKKNLNKQESSNIIWINTHNSDMFKKNKDVLFVPSKTEFEEKLVFLNMEQMPQYTTPCLNLEINVSIKNFFIKSFNTNNRDFYSLNKVFYNKHLIFIKEILSNPKLFDIILDQKTATTKLLNSIMLENFYLISTYPHKLQIEDFYSFNKRLKNSLIMQNASLQNRKKLFNF